MHDLRQVSKKLGGIDEREGHLEGSPGHGSFGSGYLPDRGSRPSYLFCRRSSWPRVLAELPFLSKVFLAEGPDRVTFSVEGLLGRAMFFS